MLQNLLRERVPVRDLEVDSRDHGRLGGSDVVIQAVLTEYVRNALEANHLTAACAS